MSRCRVTFAVAGAAGGLLSGVFLPGSAVADSYEIVPDPDSVETITSLYGLEATPPAVPEGIQGYQLFDYVDTTTGKTVGTFDAYESYNSSLYGHPTEELLVTSDVTGTSGTAAGDTPPVGSVFDIVEKGKSAAKVYSDLASTSGDQATETSETRFGDFSVRSTFDAAKGLADGTVDDHTITLANGDSILPESGSTESFTAITGYPPADVAVQGEQVFTVDGPDGTAVGTVEADVTNTQDVFGNYTEAIVVTQDLSGTPGTASGDVLPVGSILNIFYYSSGGTSLYSDLPSSSGDVISNTSTNALGWVSTHHHTTFDAYDALTTHSITLPANGDTIDPVSSLEVSGINGLPPAHVDIQGYQQFDVYDSNGNEVGSFDADVTNYMYATGKYGETILVTEDLSGTSGTGADDVPAVGSTFDTVVDGSKETIYSDFVSSSGDTFTKYLVNSAGDHHEFTDVDLSAGLSHDLFYVPSDLSTSVDASALTAMDASTGLGALLDGFPHLDAALEVLVNLL